MLQKRDSESLVIAARARYSVSASRNLKLRDISEALGSISSSINRLRPAGIYGAGVASPNVWLSCSCYLMRFACLHTRDPILSAITMDRPAHSCTHAQKDKLRKEESYGYSANPSVFQSFQMRRGRAASY